MSTGLRRCVCGCRFGGRVHLVAGGVGPCEGLGSVDVGSVGTAGSDRVFRLSLIHLTFSFYAYAQAFAFLDQDRRTSTRVSAGSCSIPRRLRQDRGQIGDPGWAGAAGASGVRCRRSPRSPGLTSCGFVELRGDDLGACRDVAVRWPPDQNRAAPNRVSAWFLHLLLRATVRSVRGRPRPFVLFHVRSRSADPGARFPSTLPGTASADALLPGSRVPAPRRKTRGRVRAGTDHGGAHPLLQTPPGILLDAWASIMAGWASLAPPAHGQEGSGPHLQDCGEPSSHAPVCGDGGWGAAPPSGRWGGQEQGGGPGLLGAGRAVRSPLCAPSRSTCLAARSAWHLTVRSPSRSTTEAG